MDWWGQLYYYAGLQCFQQAIEKAGTLDQSVIRDILATEHFTTVLGDTWFEDSNGNHPIAAGGLHTVGLKCDGTVVPVGATGYGQCNVTGWTNIVQVAAGYGHTVGLKSDGHVVAVGLNGNGQCNVGSWRLR